MQPPVDRRARKKAQTRAEVLQAAQRLFALRGFDAVTIADIANAADVAVQTVFNHFSAKEELFFAGRTPWVDGPADAVRRRAAGVSPLAALRTYTTGLLHDLLTQSGTEEHRAVIATLEASPALRAALPAVQHQAEVRLAGALAEAWAQRADDAAARGEDDTGRDVRMAASLAAALWVAGARALVQQLPGPADGTDGAATRTAVEALAVRVFDELESGLARLLDLPAA